MLLSMSRLWVALTFPRKSGQEESTEYTKQRRYEDDPDTQTLHPGIQAGNARIIPNKREEYSSA
jgi:hypothetical protein